MKWSKLQQYLTYALVDHSEGDDFTLEQWYVPEGFVMTAEGYDGEQEKVSHIERSTEGDEVNFLIQFNNRHLDPMSVDISEPDFEVDIHLYVEVDE